MSEQMGGFTDIFLPWVILEKKFKYILKKYQAKLLRQ